MALCPTVEDACGAEVPVNAPTSNRLFVLFNGAAAWYPIVSLRASILCSVPDLWRDWLLLSLRHRASRSRRIPMPACPFLFATRTCRPRAFRRKAFARTASERRADYFSHSLAQKGGTVWSPHLYTFVFEAGAGRVERDGPHRLHAAARWSLCLPQPVFAGPHLGQRVYRDSGSLHRTLGTRIVSL